jgi:hypothetical protein
MNTLQWISISLSLLGLASGAVSGWYWLRAAKPKLSEKTHHEVNLPPLPPSSRPGGPISLSGINRYIGESGELNFKAAAWSIVAVCLTAIATVLNALPAALSAPPT